MVPQARGTSLAIFSSSLYMGLTAGVALAAPFVDRFTAVPVFASSGFRIPGVMRGDCARPRSAQRRAELKDADADLKPSVINKKKTPGSLRSEVAASERLRQALAAARDPLDLGTHQALDQARQIVVEP